MNGPVHFCTQIKAIFLTVIKSMLNSCPHLLQYFVRVYFRIKRLHEDSECS